MAVWDDGAANRAMRVDNGAVWDNGAPDGAMWGEGGQTGQQIGLCAVKVEQMG